MFKGLKQIHIYDFKWNGWVRKEGDFKKMDNIIEKIIEAERKAQEIVLEAKNYKKTLAKDIESEVAKIEAAVYERMKNRIKQIHARAEAEASDEVKKIEDAAAEKVAAMDGEMGKNRGAIEARILKSILGERWREDE